MTEVVSKPGPEKIEERFKPLLDDTVELYKDVFGDNLVSVYVQGSVGRGDFVEGVSDVDTHSFTRELRTDEERKLLDEGGKKILASYPWANKIDLTNSTVEHYEQTPRLQFVISTDGVLLHGEPLKPMVDFPEVGIELARLLDSGLKNDIADTLEKMDTAEFRSPTRLQSRAQWLAKRALRLGLGLVMTQEPYYTCKIGDMPDKIIQYFPNLKTNVEALVDSRTNPASSAEELKALMKEAEPIYELAREYGIFDN